MHNLRYQNTIFFLLLWTGLFHWSFTSRDSTWLTMPAGRRSILCVLLRLGISVLKSYVIRRYFSNFFSFSDIIWCHISYSVTDLEFCWCVLASPLRMFPEMPPTLQKALQTLRFLIFPYFEYHFCLPGLGSGFSIEDIVRIRILNAGLFLDISYSVAGPDPGSGGFLTPGSGVGKNQDPDRGCPRAIKQFFG